MNNNHNYKKEYLELRHFIGGSNIDIDQYTAAMAIQMLENELVELLEEFNIANQLINFHEVKDYSKTDIDKFVCLSFKLDENNIYYYICSEKPEKLKEKLNEYLTKKKAISEQQKLTLHMQTPLLKIIESVRTNIPNRMYYVADDIESKNNYHFLYTTGGIDKLPIPSILPTLPYS